MFVALKVNLFGVKNSDFITATINFSAVIPLYFTKPNTANGAAPNMHTHERVSNPKYGLSAKYKITATIQAITENKFELGDIEFKKTSHRLK